MYALSLFSGAGGFEIGFDRAGIQTLVQVESDQWCREVLARHWPDTIRVSDVRDLDSPLFRQLRHDQRRGCASCLRHGYGEVAGFNGRFRDPARWHVDLVYGGWPCQDLSVAGQRAGLSGERSGLFHEFARVVRDLRPRWIAAENVPGLLSSDGGRDFGIVLQSLVDCGYGVAWRVLDGRWFGVPQRRRRVLIVGCLGDATRAAQVLAVCESCGGHPQARGETWEDIAPTLDDGARRSSVELPMIAATLSAIGGPSGTPGRHHEDDDNLVIQSEFDGRVSPNPRALDVELALPITNRQGIGNPDVQNFLVAAPVRASDGHHGQMNGRGDGADNLVAYALPAAARGTGDGHGNAWNSNYVASSGVRRLTPLECERLMGWPDEHTRWTVDGHEIPDSHRYRLCGNGVIATVAEWLGHRIVFVDSLSHM